MDSIRSLALLLPIVLAVSACSIFTRPIEQPIIEKELSGQPSKKGDGSDTVTIGVLGMTAERRVVLVNPGQGRFCAEAAPDIAQNISDAMKAALQVAASATDKTGSANDKEAAANAAASIEKSLNTVTSNVFQRSQGVQLFRDGSYALCQAYLNGAILGDDGMSSRNDYSNVQKSLTNLKTEYAPAAAPNRESVRNNLDTIKGSWNAFLSKNSNAVTKQYLTNTDEQIAALEKAIQAERPDPDAVRKAIDDTSKSINGLPAQIPTISANNASGAGNDLRGEYGILFDRLLSASSTLISQEIPLLARASAPADKNPAEPPAPKTPDAAVPADTPAAAPDPSKPAVPAAPQAPAAPAKPNTPAAPGAPAAPAKDNKTPKQNPQK